MNFNKCGIGCPTGYHTTGYYCNTSCGSCFSDNASRCEANVGQSFNTCGIGCPSGYHLTSTYCNTSCGSCFNDNASRCERD
jgi:hypothetical protein